MALSPTSSRPSGGSTPPTARGIFTAATVVGINIADNGIDVLDWAATTITNNVVSLTDPFRPAVLASGIYAVTVNVDPFADLTPNGFFQITLAMAESSDDPVVALDSRLATVAQGSPFGVVSNTFYIASGDLILVRVRNRDGASARHFGIETATIQRIT